MMRYADLQAAVTQLEYKPGWAFRLHNGPTMSSTCTRSAGTAPWWQVSTSTAQGVILLPPLFLVICALVTDSSDPGRQISVEHPFAVPPEGSPVTAARWLLDRILDVERHEAMEFFAIAGKRCFYPEHGPGAALYAIRDAA